MVTTLVRLSWDRHNTYIKEVMQNMSEKRFTEIENRLTKVESRVETLETNEKVTSCKMDALFDLGLAYMESVKGIRKGQYEMKESLDFLVQHTLRQQGADT